MTTLAPAPRQESKSTLPRRILLVALGVAVLVGVAVLSVPSVLGAARPDALPGVTVDGVEVGGLSDEALVAAITEIARQRAEEEIAVRRGLVDGRATGQAETVSASAAEVGYELDVDATLRAVRARGRQPNPITALDDHRRSLAGQELAVEPVQEVAERQLRSWAVETARSLALDPVEGEVELDGAEVTSTDPAPGVEVDAEAMATEARQAALTSGPAQITAPASPVAPQTTAAGVRDAAERAQRAVADPIILSRDDASLELSPAELGEILMIERLGDEWTLSASPEALEALVPDDVREELETDPVDAGFAVEDGSVEILEAEEGFRFDAQLAAAQIEQIATSEADRSATLEGETVEPERTTEDAEDLEIVEEVSSFTTSFPAGERRVANIHLIADLVDGVVLEPGETFSVNEHVGPRTREAGFVEDAIIRDGEFVDAVGGGVSQFATTLYNAAYFGGYEIPEHRPHSYYLSRYPKGREATLSYGSIDLKIHNSSPHGMLIDTSYTASSVTVTLWGTEWVEVDSIAGEPTNVRPGEERDGFDITVTRVLRYPDGREEREQQHTRYLPESS